MSEAIAAPPLPANETTSETPSKELMLKQAGNELVFAVVGHVGSGTSTIAKSLEDLLENPKLQGGKFEVVILKARDEIKEWAERNERELPNEEDKDKIDSVKMLQDRGDDMRRESRDYSVVARALVKRIREKRSSLVSLPASGAEPIPPDGKRRAYILDSIRHPAEVELLRHIYQDAFILIGIVCEEKQRMNRIIKKYKDAGEEEAKKFMKRDAKDIEKHGQRVSDAFHLSDFFIDNTEDRLKDDGSENDDWNTTDKLTRLIQIITHDGIQRPKISETAMYTAYGAAMRSACLSRQVGAALVDINGTIISTGTNEAPKAGGGVYGDAFNSEKNDGRCAFRKPKDRRYCSNTREQFAIIDKLIGDIQQLSALNPIEREALKQKLKKGRIGDLLEFSRAIHAEMDAILSASRGGIGTAGTRLFVTTFPCHYCARHIVSAGIDEVQFIEPYPKSQALDLHADAIQMGGSGKLPSEGGAKVIFRPFSGVAPRLYRRAFLKDRDLKNDTSGEIQAGEPNWGSPWHIRKVGYVELEAALVETNFETSSETPGT